MDQGKVQGKFHLSVHRLRLEMMRQSIDQTHFHTIGRCSTLRPSRNNPISMHHNLSILVKKHLANRAYLYRSLNCSKDVSNVHKRYLNGQTTVRCSLRLLCLPRMRHCFRDWDYLSRTLPLNTQLLRAFGQRRILQVFLRNHPSGGQHRKRNQHSCHRSSLPSLQRALQRPI